jgi:hypothetical protein
MNVTGPNWPSTRALQEVLKDIEGPPLRWGQGGKNGLDQLRAFKEAGLACPEFTRDLTQAKTWARSGIRTFGRRLHHTQGLDIVGTKVLRFNSKWLRRDFWVKVIPSVAEYRQHVWGDKCIRVGKKIEAGDHPRVQPVRSRANGWHLDYGWQSPSEEFTEKIRQLSKAAVACLEYQGGAVDILEGLDHKLYVLEVNSAPALADERTLEAYVRAIKRGLKKKR